MINNIAVIGSSGALGSAFVRQLSQTYPQATIHAFSRTPSDGPASRILSHSMQYEDESSIASAASLASHIMPLDLVILATGILHHPQGMPEKSLKELSAQKFQQIFAVNTVLPALVAKHFLPQLHTKRRAVFAAISARLGSISDNQLGGWYAYRASKAALNMLLKNFAIEMARRNPHVIIVGLHPGTVDSPLSKPFQANIAPEKIFSPDFSAAKMLVVLQKLTPEQSGQSLAWDGQVIAP